MHTCNINTTRMNHLPREIQNKISFYALPTPLPQECLAILKKNNKIKTMNVILKTINRHVKKFNREMNKREKLRQIKELMIFLDAYFEYTQINSQASDISKMRIRLVIKSMCTRLLDELTPLMESNNTLIILMKKYT